MRSAQKSGRSRGRGSRKGGGGGGNNINRVYDSAGPEGKVRGTPQQIIDKYLSLARDAQTSGDRVTAENFLQHAEHYQRILITATAAQEQARRDSSEQSGGPGDDQMNGADQSDQQDADTEGSQQSGEIRGMATIDTGSDDANLLVDGDTGSDGGSARQNGDGRRRRRRPTAQQEDVPPAESPESPSES